MFEVPTDGFVLGAGPHILTKAAPLVAGFRRVGTANLNLLVIRDDTPQARMIKIAAQERRGYRCPIVENRDEWGSLGHQ